VNHKENTLTHHRGDY